MPHITGKISSLFGGVSQQPDTVRAPGQVTEQINLLSSVALGGVTKRPATVHLDALADLTADTDYRVHPINRSITEQYALVLGNEEIHLFDTITGQDIPVEIEDTSRWFICNRASTASTGIVEHSDERADVGVPSGSGVMVAMGRRQPGGADDGTPDPSLNERNTSYQGVIQTNFARDNRITYGQTIGWTGFADASGRQGMLGAVIPSAGDLTVDDESFNSNATASVEDISHAFGGTDNLCVVAVIVQDEAAGFVDSVEIDPTGTPIALSRLTFLETNHTAGNNLRIEFWGVYGYTSPSGTVNVRVTHNASTAAAHWVQTWIGASGLPTGFARKRSTSGTSITTTLAFGGGTDLVYIKPAPDETTVSWSFFCTGTTLRFKIEGSPDGVAWANLATNKGGATSGTFDTTVSGSNHRYVRVNVTTAEAGKVLTVYCDLKSVAYLTGDRADFSAVSIADYTFIVNRKFVPNLCAAEISAAVDDVIYTSPTTDPASSGETAQVAFGGVADTYYFIRGVDAEGDDDGTDHWVEWRQPDRDYEINQAYMPHVLINNADGTWTFKSIAWGECQAGDAETAPAPRFIGKTVDAITVFKGRLCLLSGEHVVLSDVLDNFNFWPTSVRVALATDTFNRQVSTNTVSLLHSAVAFRQNLFLTADRVQFELTSADQGVLTGETATLQQTTSNPAAATVEPALMGDVLYFAADGPSGVQIYEYYLETGAFYNTAVEITKHIPTYIPTGVVQLAPDVNTGTLFVLTDGARNNLYVYRTYFDGQEKLQSAWCTYQFGADTDAASILGIATFDGYLIMLIQRGTDIYMEQHAIDPEAADPSIGYAPKMDRRAILTGGTYDGTSTTFELPYDTTGIPNDTIYMVPPEAPGTARTEVDRPTASSVTFLGDWSGDVCYVGVGYESSVTLSRFYARDESGDAILEGRLQLLDITVDYRDTAYFEAHVTPAFRATSERPLRDLSVILGIGNLNDPEDFDGSFRVPILAQNEDLVVTLTDDIHRFGVYGFTITSVDWRGILSDFARGL